MMRQTVPGGIGEGPANGQARGSAVLEERHMVTIMLYLMDNEGCRKTSLYDQVAHSVRMPDKLDRLESCGLITQEAARGNSVLLRLTDKGRAVAEHLRIIDSVMGDF